MSEIKEKVRSLFANQIPVWPAHALDSMSQPGIAARKVAIILTAPCKLAQPIIEQPAPIPVPSVETFSAEDRIDLPMRSPEEIRELLKTESPEATMRRIANDHARHRYQREREGRL